MSLKNKEVIIGSIVIFVLGFFIHNLYENYPNFITSIFGPVNESVFEHTKLFFTGVIILAVLQKIVWKELPNNFIFAKAMSILVMIAVMIPLFYLTTLIFGNENFVVTLIVFFISIVIGQYVSYYILSNGEDYDLDNAGLIIFILLTIVFIEMTYSPFELELFRDPLTNTYGKQ